VEKLAELDPEAGWQSCVVHFFRNVWTAAPTSHDRFVPGPRVGQEQINFNPTTFQHDDKERECEKLWRLPCDGFKSMSPQNVFASAKRGSSISGAASFSMRCGI
jgi:hypothetical protein